MSWFKFKKKKYEVREYYIADDGEVTETLVRDNLSMEKAEEDVAELQDLDALFQTENLYRYAIVEMGGLRND